MRLIPGQTGNRSLIPIPELHLMINPPSFRFQFYSVGLSSASKVESEL